MADERDEQYKPWQRDTGDAPTTPARPAAPSTAAQASTAPAVKPASVRNLSADELLARPAPLPTDSAAEGPGTGERLRDGLGKLRDWAKAANERVEPARRAKAAGRAALTGGLKAAGAVAQTTAEAAHKLRETAAPRVRDAAEAVQRGVARGGVAARNSIGKGAASARAGLSKGAEQARNQLGKRAESAAHKLRQSIPSRPELDAPVSELDRLIEREGLAGSVPASPQAATTPDLPLFGKTGAAVSAASLPPPQPRLTPPAAPITAQPPTAPLAEALQDDDVVDERVAATYSAAPFNAGSLGLGSWARHPATWVLAGLALLLAGFGIGRWSNSAALGDAIDAHILANPDIVPRAMERLQANRSAEAIGRLRGELTTAFSGAWTGNPDGDVVVTVFTDYACTFCRASVPDLERLVREDRNVKVVFRELPILSADSEAAARVALVAAQRGRYMPVHLGLFRGQVPDADARAAVLDAATLNVSPAQLNDGAINRELDSNVRLARALGIDGTPAWVIGDQLLVGAVGYDRLRTAVTAARD
jgi:hypothetical protein